MEPFRLDGDPRDRREMARLFQAGRTSIQMIEDEDYLQLSDCDLSASTDPAVGKNLVDSALHRKRNGDCN